MPPKTFDQYEQEGWQRNAATYDAIDLPTTCQAVTPILNSLGSLQDLPILELASGTGYLAAQAVTQGATITGIDISPKMVEIAQQRVPVGATFLIGDASDLPFEAEQFDAVVCSEETMAYIRNGKKSIPCPGMLVIDSKAVVRMD
ncbi:class I SAM-dependent methyltransferase [Leptothoe sp. LEGE 181152]|nr:class I SAM-dependent methyltransferase [Leptothoe sp. LEGE 181152]